MKNKSIWAFILLSACLSFALPSVGFAQDEDPLKYIEPTVPPDFPKPGDSAIAEETVNGITVKIMDVKLSIESRELWSDTEKKIKSADKKVLTFDVCFSTPDSGEWSLWGTKDMLLFDQYCSWVWDRMPSLRDEKPADGKTMGEKCERYTFDFELDIEVEPPFTLRFDQLFTSPHKAAHPCEYILNRFATNPRALAADLDVNCFEMPNGNPPGVDSKYDASVYLNGYDESILTKQEAHRLMLEIESGVIYGPWVFTIDSLNTDESQP